MNDFKFCINWDSYHNYVSKGFSSLQQNGEFVDMTLAADGHLVKVHQNIVALASPYLKAMLQSALCPHPVIFLHNISSNILGYILEYVYTGEVKVPTNVMELFVKACKSLSINGLDNITTSKSTLSEASEVPSTNNRIDKPAAHITINTEDDNNYNLNVIPNHNTVGTDSSKEVTFSEQLPAILQNNDQINNEDNNEVIDFNSINNLIVLEPTSNKYNDVELNRINKNSNIMITSDILLSGPSQNNTEIISNFQAYDSYQKESEQSSSNIQLQENPINIAVNFANIEQEITNETVLPQIAINSSSDWQIQESVSNIDNNLVKVSLRNVRKPKPCQSNVNTGLDIQTNEDVFDDYLDVTEEDSPLKLLKIKNPKTLKTLRNIGSYMKSKNKSQNPSTITLNRVDRINMEKIPHFTISNRGALQLILSRFLYHAHHHSKGGRSRRWRCVNYRKLHCPAFIDTYNEEITAMSPDHTHPNHELLIRQKINLNIVFTSLSNAVKTINTYVTNIQDENKTSVKERKNKRIEKYFCV